MTIPLRIAIATDLHYTSDESGRISPQVCIHGSKIDPMDSLFHYLDSPDPAISPKADLLICPGDITTGACTKSFVRGWDDLNKLKQKLGAKHLIAATGNHEIISRAAKEHSISGNAEIAIQPFEHLIETNNYPACFDSPDKKWVYWGRGYQIAHGDNWVVVIINSCHYHNSLLPNEYERGRIGQAALAELREGLKGLSKSYLYRIVVLHHPPSNHEDFNVDLGRTPMYNGDLLLQALEETGEDWLVIHGHKHLFRLTKSGSTEYSPIILGAASFGALLTAELANQTKNQFYIVELSIENKDSDNRLKGQFESIYWDSSSWNVCSDVAHGLPHGCGFNPSSPARATVLARAIKEAIEASPSQVMNWKELQDSISALKFLMPKEIQILHKKLDECGIKRSPMEGVWFPQDLWIDQ
ncbi:metallophosphoesterase [Pseudomonas sp. CAU 1711]|uniref:metallophosphoesterase family protein n=1 Tax=Pseudomonas sp. CAU 1711 TaxID=3140356 RepID=UPI0032618D1D